jgi:hypothetical protein
MVRKPAPSRSREAFLTALTAALCSVPISASAQAADATSRPRYHPATRHNLTFGIYLAHSSGKATIDGRRNERRPDVPASFVLDVGFHERLVPWFSLGARARILPVVRDNLTDRTYFDLGLEPRLWFFRSPATGWYVGLLSGLSAMSWDTTPNRGFSRNLSVDLSYHVGGTLGLELTPGKWPARAYMELLLLAHSTDLTVDVTSHTPELASGVEHWRYADFAFGFGVGGSFGLGRP